MSIYCQNFPDGLSGHTNVRRGEGIRLRYPEVHILPSPPKLGEGSLREDGAGSSETLDAIARTYQNEPVKVGGRTPIRRRSRIFRREAFENSPNGCGPVLPGRPFFPGPRDCAVWSTATSEGVSRNTLSGGKTGQAPPSPNKFFNSLSSGGPDRQPSARSSSVPGVPTSGAAISAAAG